jgi:ribosomal-protein-serine acetyltransferase
MLSISVDKEITLKLPSQNDAQEIFALVDLNRAYLRHYLPWVDRNQSLKDTESFIQDCRRSFQEGMGFSLCIQFNEKIVGMIGFDHFDKDNQKIEIGYWLSEDQQGKGIMLRSCQAMVDYAFKNLNVHRVEIRCVVDNKSSKKIPEKLGFKLEGLFKESTLLQGQFYDTLLYGLVTHHQK